MLKFCQIPTYIYITTPYFSSLTRYVDMGKCCQEAFLLSTVFKDVRIFLIFANVIVITRNMSQLSSFNISKKNKA